MRFKEQIVGMCKICVFLELSYIYFCFISRLHYSYPLRFISSLHSRIENCYFDFNMHHIHMSFA
jgi:hypothetical protein